VDRETALGYKCVCATGYEGNYCEDKLNVSALLTFSHLFTLKVVCRSNNCHCDLHLLSTVLWFFYFRLSVQHLGGEALCVFPAAVMCH